MDEFCRAHDFRLLAEVPFDGCFAEAERLGMAPIDLAPHSPGVEAVRQMAGRLGDDQ